MNRQLKRMTDAAGLRALGCLLLLALALSAQAVNAESKEDRDLALLLTPSVTPMYLEKSSDPHTLTPQAGWQVGGINTRYAATGDGSLNFAGGFFYGRSTAPRSLIDKREGLPGSNFGADSSRGLTDTSGLVRMFQSGPAGGTQRADQITYQRVGYQRGGLSLSGGYSEVGKDFQGLDALAQSMKGSDPTTAKALALGMRSQDYAVGYKGARGLNLASTYASVANEQAGHKENGLTRTTRVNSLGMGLGSRGRFDYSVSSLAETWNPASGKHDEKTVDTQVLKLSEGMGRKSEIALGQTLTSTTVGTTETDVQQRDVALKWNEWQKLILGASYTTKETEQTGEATDTLALNVTAPISPYLTVAGKLSQTDVEKPNATTQENDLLDLKVTSTLTPTLQVSTQFQNTLALDTTENTVRDHTVVWSATPNWKVTCRRYDADNSKVGETSKMEIGASGQVGTKACPETLSLFRREEALPNDIAQNRTEVTYTRPLGDKAATLLVRAGNYDYTNKSDVRQHNLITAQCLAAKPTKHTTLSMGYYQGPAVGATNLAYRSWGQKPQGSVDAIWQTKDLATYDEVGGELTHNITRSTKLVAKTFTAETDGIGEWQTDEYGMEQRVGSITFLGGRRVTTQPTAADVTESWWRMTAPRKAKLAPWAVSSLGSGLFQDAATWGFSAAPAWASKPVAGLTLDRRNVLAGGKPVSGTAVQYAGMVSSRIFADACYDRNPNKADKPAEIDALRRGMLHLGYAVTPSTTVYARYQQTMRLDANSAEESYTLGLVLTGTNKQRLQLASDAVTRTTNGASQSGTSYALEYERALQTDDTLSLKCRLTPAAFTPAADRLRLEGSYRKTF
jgi:hypothetical protein